MVSSLNPGAIWRGLQQNIDLENHNTDFHALKKNLFHIIFDDLCIITKNDQIVQFNQK